MKNKIDTINKIIEYGIYAFILIMFLAKGEGMRNIIIFGNFGLWLVTLKYRQDLYILKNAVSKLCWIYIGITAFSVACSIDPHYSLKAIKDEPLKFALLFPVIATTMADRARLKNVSLACLFALVILVSLGYYSYIFLDTPVLKPQTILANAHHNRFAGYINTLLPIAFVFCFFIKGNAKRIAFILLLVISVIGLILCTSRGGYISFLGIALVWSLYLSRSRGYNFKRIFMSIVTAVILLVVLSYAFNPDVKGRLSETSEQLTSLSNRTDLWWSALYAIKKRPLIGWGYGTDIFFREEPFRGNPYYKDPIKGQHNMFVTIAFHQGIIGLISFVLLIVVSLVTFWKESFQSAGIKSYMLIACTSIFFGNYLLHAQLESMFKLEHISVVLGLGLAARGMNEDSHS